MDNKDTNNTNMIRTTNQYCADNSSATAAIVAFAPVLATSQSKLLLIDQLDQIAMNTTSGITLDTKALRKTMTAIAIKCASATFAYAVSVKNNTLKAQVDYSKSELDGLKKEEIDDVSQTIHDATNANIANVQNWGATPTDITDLQTAINLYRIGSQNPRTATINRSDAKKQIKVLIREIISNLFKGQMDRMALTLKTSNPNFVNKYFLSREIIDLGKTTTKIRGTAADENKNPLENVLIALRVTGVPTRVPAYQTQSDVDGKFGIANIKPNNYDIEISLANYNTLTETNIRFAPGKELKRKYILIATLPPPPPPPVPVP